MSQQILVYLHNPLAKVLIPLAIVWTLIWKGLALWKSAGNRQKAWFVIMLVLNTLGILEIIYLIWFSKKDQMINL